MAQDSLSILLVGGHPADAFDNAGGTLAHHAAAGDRVVSAVMTHGVRSHAIKLIDRYRTGDQSSLEIDQVDGEVREVVEEKRDEVREACALMGIDEVHFLEHDDDVLMEREDLIRQIADIIQESRPDIVITHHPWERGGVSNTHSLCASMTLSAIDAAGGLLRASSRRPHRVGQVFFMGVMAACAPLDVLTGGMSVWCDVYVDITDVIERKVAALDLMRGQNYDGPYARKRVESVDGHFGLFSGVAYAEPFTSMHPQVYDRLPLTPHTRIKAHEATDAWQDRVCRLLAAKVPDPSSSVAGS
ncbi:MAG: PIG-L deacetylase family protein [Candidatus Latescibacterota bacterium]|nr:PIG-L deacetylase family protein [Candidatus Latescibacterota bacterium]